MFTRHSAILWNALAATGLALVLSACDEATTQPVAATPSRTAMLDEVVAATVDGYAIYVSDAQLEAEAQGLLPLGEPIDVDSAMFTRVLNGLIDDHLLAVEASEQNLDRDPFVQHRIKVLRNRILGNALLNQGVDETSIQRYYETAVSMKQMQLGEEFRIQQIVVQTREEADALLKDMSKVEDFSVLASDRSIDEATRMEGGLVGYINPDQAPEALARAIRNTPIGGVSRPFESDMGWHIIKVIDKRPEAPPTLAELRPQIHNFLVASELDRLLKKLHRDATIIRSFEEVEGPDVDPFSAAEETDETAADDGPEL